MPEDEKSDYDEVDSDAEFSLPPKERKRLKNKEKMLEKAEKAKRKEEKERKKKDGIDEKKKGRKLKKDNESEDEESSEDVWRYFMNGKCRHGFHGNTPKGDIQKCRFTHPKVCRKLMDHGRNEGGCKGKCDKTHPRMCPSSLEKGEYEHVDKGIKCGLGYHVKGTTTPE